jgi:surface polysaccharide O-acyltransferase-like enzyme
MTPAVRESEWRLSAVSGKDCTSALDSKRVKFRRMSEQINRKEIKYWADFIRVIAIYLVVIIHVSGQITNEWGQIPPLPWMLANVYGSVARISVPLFFMMSGYLLLPKSESLHFFYTRRVMKIFIPLVFWSLIYLGWFCGNHPNTCTSSFVRDSLLVNGTYYHLWFLYSLLGIYLVVPVLRLMFNPGGDKKIFWYLIGLWLIFQPGLTVATTFWNFRINLGVPLAAGFVGFFFLGYLLGELGLTRFRIILAFVLWLVAAIATIAGTYFLSLASGQLSGFFYDFVSLNVIVASGAGFILLRWLSGGRIFASARIRSSTRSLALTSYGIYLIHILVIEILNDRIPFVHINAFMGNPLWSIPFVATLVFFISFLLVTLLQRIPVLNQTVP